jgi:hypothetical protein
MSEISVEFIDLMSKVLESKYEEFNWGEGERGLDYLESLDWDGRKLVSSVNIKDRENRWRRMSEEEIEEIMKEIELRK